VDGADDELEALDEEANLSIEELLARWVACGVQQQEVEHCYSVSVMMWALVCPAKDVADQLTNL